jgi:hypothetical protein
MGQFLCFLPWRRLETCRIRRLLVSETVECHSALCCFTSQIGYPAEQALEIWPRGPYAHLLPIMKKTSLAPSGVRP